MSTSTMTAPAAATITISDGSITSEQTLIDGKSLEEYFKDTGLAAPEGDYTAVSNGRRLPNDYVPVAGEHITVGRKVKNG